MQLISSGKRGSKVTVSDLMTVVEKYLISPVAANCHPLGTAAMMPKELGGVVDNRLRVYGTRNVRVVDASIMPFQVSGHLSSTVYAIAERAADMIKQDAG
jgi:choline dehydrogenase-like flavoprotein